VPTKSCALALILALVLPVLAAAEPATFKVNQPHSSVGFTIRHFVSEVPGRFKDFGGSIKYDKDNPANSSVQFTVQAASISTDNPDRDKHLSSPDFFDVQKYPTLTFVSTSVKPRDAKTLDVTGDFTMHGVTKRITIPVTVQGSLKTPQGEKAGFRANFSVNRMDYGVAWNRAVEGGGAMLGDEVDISIRTEADKQQEAPSGH
jgi:polyisoprenoid-binding protein YceI